MSGQEIFLSKLLFITSHSWLLTHCHTDTKWRMRILRSAKSVECKNHLQISCRDLSSYRASVHVSSSSRSLFSSRADRDSSCPNPIVWFSSFNEFDLLKLILLKPRPCKYEQLDNRIIIKVQRVVQVVRSLAYYQHFSWPTGCYFLQPQSPLGWHNFIWKARLIK